MPAVVASQFALNTALGSTNGMVVFDQFSDCYRLTCLSESPKFVASSAFLLIVMYRL